MGIEIALVAVIAALGLVVAAQHRRTRRVDAQLHELRELVERSLAERPCPDQRPAEPVPVITALAATGGADAPLPASSRRVVSVTLGTPLIKSVAFVNGVRRALDDESRMRVGYAFRRELKRQRKLRRRAASSSAGQQQGWVS